LRTPKLAVREDVFERTGGPSERLRTHMHFFVVAVPLM